MTWQTTSFLVFSLVRKTSCPGAREEARRITAPWTKTRTVLVDSEKGARLSEPSTVRAPLTVTGISRATGWGRTGVSLAGLEGRTAGGAEAVGVATGASSSFKIGAIEYPPREGIKQRTASRESF